MYIYIYISAVVISDCYLYVFGCCKWLVHGEIYGDIIRCFV